jgi:hypothetical protein
MRVPATAVCLALLLPGGVADSAPKPAAKASPTAEKPAPRREIVPVPEDLLQDEHVREEFGVNEFTAPSIKKLFAELAEMGALPYEKLRRDIPKSTPKDRARVALALGMLIADGFLMVHTEKISEFEDVGRAVLKHAKVLGSGDRVSRHTKAIIENSVSGDWELLKTELAKTQADVEAEMILLRDHEIAHLISLGGWVRGLEICSTASLDPFSEAKARKLARVDLVEYFQSGIEDLPAKIKDRDPVKSIRQALDAIHETINKPDPQPLTAEEVEHLRARSAALVRMISTVPAEK